MCWSMGATAVMVTAGAVATGVTLYRRDPLIFSITIGYFTYMEALQIFGYAVIDQCGLPANQVVTMLSMLHIVFQPLVINAFAMALFPPSTGMKVLVFLLAGVSSVVMLLQIYPFEWAGACVPDSNLCAEQLCTVTGDWHLAWDVPFNGLMNRFDGWFGLHFGFPTYMIATFALPILYGAWRFALFHLLFGPVLAGMLTSNPNEVPAIWCLSSIAITLIALSPPFRRKVVGGAVAV